MFASCNEPSSIELSEEGRVTKLVCSLAVTTTNPFLRQECNIFTFFGEKTYLRLKHCVTKILVTNMTALGRYYPKWVETRVQFVTVLQIEVNRRDPSG